MAVFGIVLAVVAWKASVPVLSGIVVFAGAFIVLVAMLTTSAVAYQAWQERASRAQ